MSLRIFHMIFIVASIALSLFGGVWGIRLHAAQPNVSALLTGIFFLTMAGALAAYGVKAYSRLRKLA